MFTLDSGNPALVNASSFRSSRLPVVTIFEYPAIPSIMLSSSGKCNPYHSRNRELSALHTLSTSSNVFIDCITCRSGLLETSVTFDDESDIAKSRSFSKASFSSDANPDSTSIFGFSICIFLRYSSPAICASIDSFFSMLMSDSSVTKTPDCSFMRRVAKSAGMDFCCFIATYSSAGFSNGIEYNLASSWYTWKL